MENNSNNINHEDDDCSSSGDENDLNFANIDFSGVQFDASDDDDDHLNFSPPLSLEKSLVLLGSAEQRSMDLGNSDNGDNENGIKYKNLLSNTARKYIQWIQDGCYIEVLQEAAEDILRKEIWNENTSMYETIRQVALKYISADEKNGEIVYQRAIDLQLVAIAALTLFLQLNYTGPTLNDDKLVILQNIMLQICNSDRQEILAELSVDGELCCSIVEEPYLLLLSRSLLHFLALPNYCNWFTSIDSRVVKKVISRPLRAALAQKSEADDISININRRDDDGDTVPTLLEKQELLSAKIWSGRASVAHQRLLNQKEPSVTLFEETSLAFRHCIDIVNGSNNDNNSLDDVNARIMLEYGLALHHFDHMRKAKQFFQKAMDLSKLSIELTGALGKRTKYQSEEKAQLIVRAQTVHDEVKDEAEGGLLPKRITYDEDTHLLERVKYESEQDNNFEELSMFNQAILLSLCLDVKNENPADIGGLTSEMMMAYIERVLLQHDDWMIYASALLERAWIECEKSNRKERALLQIQALVDQHTERLTITQSTVKAAVEDSAPPQERLQNLHVIVYPPRWAIKADLAEKYAKIGIVTTAAELFTEVEMWDEVVECYRRAGKENKAAEVVRSQLKEEETPRMWAALGDITKDISFYQKALELSHFKFADAYFALGKYYFDKNDITKASEMLQKGLDLKPLSPGIWFLLGTISMRVQEWSIALKAFSEVVQQEPEEGDAWGNISAIHMYRKAPSKAYPALNEVCVCVDFLLFVIYFQIIIGILPRLLNIKDITGVFGQVNYTFV